MELLLFIGGFFMATVAVAWLMLFPTGRAAVSGITVATGARVTTGASRWASRRANVGRAAIARGRRIAAGAASYLMHHRRLFVAMALIMCVPPLIITQLQYRPVQAVIGFESDVVDEALITRLLRGERLAPPAPVVPAKFTTREVKLIRPTLYKANRDWAQLKPDFRQRLLVVYKLMREKYGYNMVMIEGYRSPQRQKALATNKPNVTNAGAFESYHQFGLAADSAFMRDGKVVISARNDWAMRGYRLYGKLAEAVGLTWGGDWQLHDYGHVELRRPGVLH